MLLADRFWAKVDKSGECWLWLASTNQDGYGRILDDGKLRPAHVVSWELEHGKPFPAGKIGLHSCDTPACVRPKHVIPGTHRQNALDRKTKGRQASKLGRLNGRALLTEKMVQEIRNSPLSRAQAAAKFGVAAVTVKKIRQRKLWSHVV